MQTATTDPLIGRILEGRYRIRARLAIGGMSTVYAAVDERLDRHVAVKVMSSSLGADPAFVNRFAHEARAAARLSHVNTVSVYDQGSDAGHVFLVMELVRGRTLRDLLRERGLLSPAEAVSIMEPVLSALAAAHRAGLVHRDVKPENILLADDGVVKVADFGLARAVEADAAATHTGLMMGTVAYSSPEQFRRGHADTRSDVYSAGIVLFELLTGRTPYQGPTAMAVAYRHVHEDVPPPSTWQRGIAGPLDDLVRRATSRDAAGRPVDAGTLLAQIHDVRRELRLPVLPVPPRPRGPNGNPTQVLGATAGPRPHPGARDTRTGTGRDQPTIRDPRTGPPVQYTLVAGEHTPVGAEHTLIAGEHTLVAGAHTARNRPPRRRRRRFVRTLIGALLLLLVCAAIIFGSWWFTAGRYTSIPDVRDRPTRDAVTALRAHGLQVVTDRAQVSDTVVRGAVIRSEPGSGARILPGHTVHVTPSAGPRTYALPDVRGRTRAAAAQALAALSRVPVRVTYAERADDRVAAGSVVTTDPAPGTRVAKDATVVVYVSTGAPFVAVPDVRDAGVDAATATLSAAKFQVRTTDDFSDTVAPGQVISQDPGGGSQQREFSTVTLSISQGPELIEVPALPRLDDADDAEQRLRAAGFEVTRRKHFGGLNGLVISTDPRAGTKLKRGSTVTINVI